MYFYLQVNISSAKLTVTLFLVIWQSVKQKEEIDSVKSSKIFFNSSCPLLSLFY